MSKRRNHDAAFRARVALEALKGERTVSELAAAYEVHPTMVHQWKKALLKGAAGIFDRGGQAAATAEIAEETVRDLHAKIGDPQVRLARDHEHGSGQPVHVLRMDRPTETGGHPVLDGWKGTLHGQHLHRTPVAVPEV